MRKDKETIIQVENLSKVFKLPHEKLATVKQHFLNLFNPKGYEKFKALDKVSFEVKKGEFFGFIGSNGSGKSTLLKILAGVYQPTSGRVVVEKSLSPFIELGVGLNPELTARENIFLNAAILGLTKKQTEEKFDEIVEFSELRNFLDQKLKNFSSGMQVRLAFSIAVQAQAEILLVDEVLAVGDASFQQKCLDLFRKLKKEGKTIIFVSHSLSVIQEFCDRCILMKKGEVRFIGNPNQAVLEYMKINAEEEQDKISKSNQVRSSSSKKDLIISEVKTLNNSGSEVSIFNFGEDINVKLKVKGTLLNKEINFGVAIFREDNVYCSGVNTIIDGVNIRKNLDVIELKFTHPSLLPGSYYLVAALFGKSDNEVLDFNPKAAIFNIVGDIKEQGVSSLDHQWIQD